MDPYGINIVQEVKERCLLDVLRSPSYGRALLCRLLDCARPDVFSSDSLERIADSGVGGMTLSCGESRLFSTTRCTSRAELSPLLRRINSPLASRCPIASDTFGEPDADSYGFAL